MTKDRISRVTTSTGDSGRTALSDGVRMSKSDTKMELIGTLDESNSFLGFAVTLVDPKFTPHLRRIQSRLFDIGAVISTNRAIGGWLDEVEWLEDEMKVLNDQLPALKEFILPGGNESASRIHLARTVARRAERCYWNVYSEKEIDIGMGGYLNRLSDCFFVLARYCCRDEVLWEPKPVETS